jgi:hypothetical protein
LQDAIEGVKETVFENPRLSDKSGARLKLLATTSSEKACVRTTNRAAKMNRQDIEKCKQHVGEALCILEREADSQPEVRLLIALREAMEDIQWLEVSGQFPANVVRLSDVKYLRSNS